MVLIRSGQYFEIGQGIGLPIDRSQRMRHGSGGVGDDERFSEHDPLGFWKNANQFTAANVTGQPALALLAGFGSSGMPVGLEILGRPFGEQALLQIGHVYRSVTDWHRTHPVLLEGATAPNVEEPKLLAGTSSAGTEGIRLACEAAVHRAGIRLTPMMVEQLLEGAPYAVEMASRLARDHRWPEPPANMLDLSPKP